MELLKDEDPLETEAVKQFLKGVLVKEEEAFNRIYTRSCLMNGVVFDLSKIHTTPKYEERPNYGEYYYLGPVLKGTGTKHFLMSRDIVMVDGEELPVLNIVFNADLLDETKEK